MRCRQRFDIELGMRRNHAEHPASSLGVRQDAAMEGPDTRCIRLDDHVPVFGQ